MKQLVSRMNRLISIIASIVVLFCTVKYGNAMEDNYKIDNLGFNPSLILERDNIKGELVLPNQQSVSFTV